MKKRGECFKLSTLIAGASATGDRAIYTYTNPRYEIRVESDGFINVKDAVVKSNSLEVFCSFHAALVTNYTLTIGDWVIIGGFGRVSLQAI